LEVARRPHFFKQGKRQAFAALHMGRHVADDFPLPAEVFHELAGQLHRVPLYAADAGHIAFIDLREQMVQKGDKEEREVTQRQKQHDTEAFVLTSQNVAEIKGWIETGP
jgi:hypothetical protein